MPTHHRLVEVGRHFCNEQGVIRINKRLMLPGEIGMHGMSQLMCQGTHARHFVGVAHVNERMSSLRAPRKRALHLTLIWVHIHPALFQYTLSNRLYVFLTHGSKTFTDQLNAFFERHFHFLRSDRRPHVIISKFLKSQRLAPDFEITMPDG